MNNSQSYESLVVKYKETAQFLKKLELSGGIMQVSIFVFMKGWKYLEIPFYELGGMVLFSWALYLVLNDYLTFLRIEKMIAQVILDGRELEKKNTRIGNFFHQIFVKFDLVRILSQRSFMNLVTFGGLGYFLSQFIADLNPSLAISYRLLAVISGILTIIACKFYYDALKSLADSKTQALAK